LSRADADKYATFLLMLMDKAVLVGRDSNVREIASERIQEI
jgi:hypothetical protein